MPNTNQINDHILIHGYKDQLLAIFDQTLSSKYLFEDDPLLIKSVFNLSYLIREIATNAVVEVASSRLSPFEQKKAVEAEIMKLYWHFFSAQKKINPDLRARYRGIEKLKTIAHLINKASFCAQNPENITESLRQVGIEDWGTDLIDQTSAKNRLSQIQEKIGRYDQFKNQFDVALDRLHRFREQEKNIKQSFAELRKSMVKQGDISHVSKSIWKHDNKLPASKIDDYYKMVKFIEAHVNEQDQTKHLDSLRSLILNVIDNVAKVDQLLEATLNILHESYQLPSATTLSDSLENFTKLSVLDKRLTAFEKQLDKEQKRLSKRTYEDGDSINIRPEDKFVEPRLKQMIRFCLGDEVTLSPHELTLVHEIEAAYGHSIVSMTKEDFIILQPKLIRSFDEHYIPSTRMLLDDNEGLMDEKEISLNIPKALQPIMDASYGKPVKLSDFEKQVLIKVEQQLGLKIHELSKDYFESLKSTLLNVLEKRDISEFYYWAADNCNEAFDAEHAPMPVYETISEELHIDLDNVDPILASIVDYSLGKSVTLPEFEHQLINKVERTLKFRLVDLQRSEFNLLEPILIDAINTKSWTKIHAWMAATNPKKIFEHKHASLSSELAQKVLWPSQLVVSKDLSSSFVQQINFLLAGRTFDQSSATTYSSLKSLLNQSSMKYFNQLIRTKMCSYTPALTNMNPMHIDLGQVNQDFQEKTRDMIFKFASYAELLDCQNLSQDEQESLKAAVERTVQKLNLNNVSLSDADKMSPLATWTLERLQTLGFEGFEAVLTADEKNHFKALYAASPYALGQWVKLSQPAKKDTQDFSVSKSSLKPLIQLASGEDVTLSSFERQLFNNINHLKGFEFRHLDVSALKTIEPIINEAKASNAPHLVVNWIREWQIKPIISEKVELIGGYWGLSARQIADVLKLIESANQKDGLNRACDWLDNEYLVTLRDSLEYKQGSSVGELYKHAQSLSEDAKQLLNVYFQLKSDMRLDKKSAERIGSTSRKALTQLFEITEYVLQKPLYVCSNETLAELQSFLGKNEIDYSKWRLWLNDCQNVDKSSKHTVDVIRLLDMACTEEVTVAFAISKTLSWINTQKETTSLLGLSPMLTLLDIENSQEPLSQSQIKTLVAEYASLKFKPPRSPIFHSKFGSFKATMDENIESLEKELNTVDKASIDIDTAKFKKLLIDKKYELIYNRDELRQLQTAIKDKLEELQQNVAIFSQGETQLAKLGFEVDFNQEDKADLPYYYLFLDGLLNNTHSNTFFDSAENIVQKTKFTVQSLKRNLLKHKTKLQTQYKEASQSYDSSFYAPELADELRLIYLAFNAVNNEKAIEDIDIDQAINVTGYNYFKDRNLMNQAVSVMQKPEIIDQQALSNVIKALRFLQRIKSVSPESAQDVSKHLDQSAKTTFTSLVNEYNYDGDANHLKIRTIANGAFNKALEKRMALYLEAQSSLKNHCFDSVHALKQVMQAGLVSFSMSHLVSISTTDVISELIDHLGYDSNESTDIMLNLDKQRLSEITQSMSAEKLSDWLFYLSQNTDAAEHLKASLGDDKLLEIKKLKDHMIDVDINETINKDIAKEKILFFLSQNHKSTYEKLCQNVVMNKLVEQAYGLYLIDSENLNGSDNKGYHILLRSSVEGQSDLIKEFLMYLMPPKTDIKFLEQLMAQFAPDLEPFYRLKHSKYVADLSLSAWLLNHHGAGKLFANNCEYHICSQLANLSMMMTFTMLIVAIVLWSLPIVLVCSSSFVASLFMKICTEHMKQISLRPYAKSDQLGLVDSIEAVESIWVKYDDIESQLLVKMLEDSTLIKDKEPIWTYQYQISKREEHFDLVKLCELESELQIENNGTETTRQRWQKVCEMKFTSLLKLKQTFKELDIKSNIVLTNKQYDRVVDILASADQAGMKSLPKETDRHALKEAMFKIYCIEHSEISAEKIEAMCNFVFMTEGDKEQFDFSDPMSDLDDNLAAKMVSNIESIKKIKTQMEDFSSRDEFFPSASELTSIPGVKADDIKYMQDNNIDSFKKLRKLINENDYSGNRLTSGAYNKSLENILMNHLRSSGDIRVVNQIKPISMFGAIEVKGKDLDLDDDHSSDMRVSSPI